MMTKVPCTISIDDALLKQIDEYAKDVGLTRSTVIQIWVREGLKRAKKAAGK